MRLMSVFLGVVAFALAACGDVGPTPSATQESPGAGSQIQQSPTTYRHSISEASRFDHHRHRPRSATDWTWVMA